MRQATPTDYKGITFRSKTEAIFARCMDLFNLGSSKFLWDYEPATAPFKLMDWNPDFWLTYIGGNPFNIEPKGLIIELKPSAPSRAYMESFGKKMARLCRTYAPQEGMIIAPNFYDSGPDGILFEHWEWNLGMPYRDGPEYYVGDGWYLEYSQHCDQEEHQLARFASQAMEYRFDLERPSA